MEISAGPAANIPAGTFEIGGHHDLSRDLDEVPIHTVSLSAFEIGIFEITNQEYADILNWALENDFGTEAHASL